MKVKRFKKINKLIVGVVLLVVILAGCAPTNSQQYETGTSEPVAMIPTEADMQGAFDSYLYVPLEGETYRYERTDLNTKNVTIAELLYQL